MLRSRRPLQAAYFELENVACLVCQWRSFSTTYRYFAEPPSKPALPTSSTSPALLSTDAFPNAPRSYGKSVDEFTPEPLLRPIGLPNPPQPGENLGIDRRTWRQRREDFVDYDKHVAKRKMLFVYNPFEP
jgi:ATPase complex subunit ATP10